MPLHNLFVYIIMCSSAK